MAKQAIKTCRRRPHRRRQRPNRSAAAAVCCHRELPAAQWGRNLASMAAQILARFSEKRFSLCCGGGHGHQRRRGVPGQRDADSLSGHEPDGRTDGRRDERASAYFH